MMAFSGHPHALTKKAKGAADMLRHIMIGYGERGRIDLDKGHAHAITKRI